MGIPARKITNIKSKKNTGFFPSIKNERPIAYESLLERDFIYLLEFDKDVISYIEQPETITYHISNRRYRYTPDFLVIRKNKKQLIEVKPYKKLLIILEDEIKKKKFIEAASYCKSQGYQEFKIFTDKDIDKGYLKNIKYLFSFSKLKVPASCKLIIQNELMDSGPQKISQILFKLATGKEEVNKYYSYILAMLYHQEIKTELSCPINKMSIIEL